MKALQKKIEVENALEYYMTTPRYVFRFANVLLRFKFFAEDVLRDFLGIFVSESTDEKTTQRLIDRAKKRKQIADLLAFHKCVVKARRKIEEAIIHGRTHVFFALDQDSILSPSVKNAICLYLEKNALAKKVDFCSGFNSASTCYIEIQL